MHGVTVADPVWAELLRRAGVFSGRPVRHDQETRDAVLRGLRGGVVVSDLPDHPQDRADG